MLLVGRFFKQISVCATLMASVGSCFASDEILSQEDVRARAFENYIPSLQFNCAYSVLTVGISACDEDTKNAMKLSIKDVLFDVVYTEDIHVHYFFQAILPLIEGVMDGYGRAAIMKALIAVPMLDRSCVSSLSCPFMEGMSDGLARALLIGDVAQNPLYKDVPFTQAVMPLLKGMNNIDERSSMMNALSDLPRQGLLALCQSIFPYVEDVIDDFGRATIVKILARNQNILRFPEKIPSTMIKMRAQNAHWFRSS